MCRGEKFRTEFLHLGEVRSIVSESVRVMALTATASRQFIIKSLCMLGITYRDNIIYSVLEKPKERAEVYFKNIALKTEGTNMDRVLIFCRTYNNVIAIYQYFRKELGEYMTYPPGSPNFVVNRTGCLHPLHT